MRRITIIVKESGYGEHKKEAGYWKYLKPTSDTGRPNKRNPISGGNLEKKAIAENIKRSRILGKTFSRIRLLKTAKRTDSRKLDKYLEKESDY